MDPNFTCLPFNYINFPVKSPTNTRSAQGGIAFEQQSVTLHNEEAYAKQKSDLHFLHFQLNISAHGKPLVSPTAPSGGFFYPFTFL